MRTLDLGSTPKTGVGLRIFSAWPCANFSKSCFGLSLFFVDFAHDFSKFYFDLVIFTWPRVFSYFSKSSLYLVIFRDHVL